MVVREGIRKGLKKGIDFGDYTVKEKLKVNDFEDGGHVYYIKTHDNVTRLERDSKLLMETVPGAAVHSFVVEDEKVVFEAEGQGSTMVTLDLEPETEYRIYIEDVYADKVNTQISGKVSFSLDLKRDIKEVRIEKVS